MEPASKGERGTVSFGAKVVPSLNGVDPSFVNSVAGSYLYMIQKARTFAEGRH